jgi:predicted Fe-Mo cluster-binding NifX family protein
MLAGGIGNEVIDILNDNGINVIRGCSGDVETIVEQYLAGNINDSGVSCAKHDNHHKDGNGNVCNH